MRRTYAALLCGWAILATGCGEETATVTGKVVFAKPPAQPEEVQVVMVGKSGQPQTVTVESDGSFTASGVEVGEVRVGLACQPAAYVAAVEAYTESVDETGKPKVNRRKPGRRPAVAPSLEKFPNPVPAAYWDPLKSPVRWTTQPGENSFEIRIAN